MKEFNPFSVAVYSGPEYFCDREEDKDKLINAAENGRSLVLSSMRRLGKTGLLHHFQYYLSKTKKWICIYLDILDSSSDEEIINRLISESMYQLEKTKENFVQRTLKSFGRFSPKFSVDPITGTPAVELTFNSPQDFSISVDILFRIFAEQKKRVQISIDEFQQIANFEKPSRLDSIIRNHIQTTDNVHFIFSGSQKHLLADLFSNPKKPMFSMAQYHSLKHISYPNYFEFIQKSFKKNERTITDQATHEILGWSKIHTYYTQFICNRLYGMGKKEITIKEVNFVKLEIFKELEFIYLNYKNILTKNQFKVLKGIGIKNEVSSVRTIEFTSENKIPSSTAQQSLDYLVDKELIYEEITLEKKTYFVYDVFLSRWLGYFGR